MPLTADAPPELDVPNVIEARAEESEQLEYLYDEEVAEGVVPSGKQLEWLREAVEAQREHVRLAGLEDADFAPVVRLRHLEDKFARATARSDLARAESLERLADEQLAGGERSAALQSLREALDLQERIHQDEGLSEFHRPKHLGELRARVEAVQLEPLRTERDRLQARGNQSALGGNLVAAERLLREALALQERINREFPLSTAAGRARMAQIEEEIASLDAVRLGSERDEIVLEAVRRRDAGLRGDAARLFERAIEIQRQINTLHPTSRFAGVDLVEKFEAARREMLDGAAGAGLP